MLTECYIQFKQFTKIKKIIFIIASLQLLGFTLYEAALHYSFLDGILTIIICYVMGISIPYYNCTAFNQIVFYLTQKEIDSIKRTK
jgi:hypothetical protein